MLKISPDNIRLNILLPFIIIVTLLVSLGLITTYALQKNTLRDATFTRVSQYQSAYKHELQVESELLKGLTTFISNDDNIQNLWLKQKRELLFEYTLPIFERLRDNHSITHFYFHQLDSTNFLRVHQHLRSGDKINRSTLSDAIKNNKVGAGIELGVFGRFVLRVVTPWYVNGELSGYIELGKEIENIAENISQSLNINLIYAVNKSLITKSTYENYLHLIGKKSTWDELESEAIIDSTFENFSSLNWFFKKNIKNIGNKIHEINLSEKQHHGILLPLKDASQSIVGRVLLIHNVEKEKKALEYTLYRISFIAIILTIIASIFYIIYISKLELKISSLVKKLSKEIKEHEKTETNLKNSHHELKAINTELESYSYSIAHDLRTPLRAITSFSQILKDDANDKLSDHEKSSLERIIKAGIYMSSLIDDILKLTKVSREKIEKKNINLSELAHDILSRLEKANPDNNTQIEIEDNLITYGAPSMLALLLENLLGNAWKFSIYRKNAKIQLGSIKQSGRTVFFVKDNGAGFEMEHASKLFETFQRLHGKDEFEGNGIGLAMVQRIVHRHGGEIWAESSVNQGATFYFTIPKN